MSKIDLKPEVHQFDFWLGDWTVTWADNQSGTNHIRAILDEAVILENFDGRPGTPLVGLSVSTYNAALGRWQQTWVDNQATYLDFSGEFKDGQMVLQRTAVENGVEFWQRMVWYNLEPQQLDWNWERSDDGGQTWRVVWHLHYARQA